MRMTKNGSPENRIVPTHCHCPGIIAGLVQSYENLRIRNPREIGQFGIETAHISNSCLVYIGVVIKEAKKTVWLKVALLSILVRSWRRK